VFIGYGDAGPGIGEANRIDGWAVRTGLYAARAVEPRFGQVVGRRLLGHHDLEVPKGCPGEVAAPFEGAVGGPRVWCDVKGGPFPVDLGVASVAGDERGAEGVTSLKDVSVKVYAVLLIWANGSVQGGAGYEVIANVEADLLQGYRGCVQV